jgi:hypothetical protein
VEQLGNVFYLEMGVGVRRFHEQKAVGRSLGLMLALGCEYEVSS